MGAAPGTDGIVIRKRGDAWVVAVYDPLTKGKRWIGTYPSRKAAEKAEAQAKLSRTELGPTIDTYAARWLLLHPRGRRSTMIQYEEAVARFARAFTGSPLGAISKVRAREWALENRAAHGAVRAMYADAIRDGLITENPFAGLRLQQSRGRKDLDVLSHEQVQQALRIADGKFGPSFAAMIATAAYCGLRPGELYALTWENIDLAHDELVVRFSYSSKSKETTAPKTKEPRRPVLFPEARVMLERLPRTPGPVFRTVQGKPMSGRVIHFYWDPVRTAIGRPGESFYALRHFCAARLLNDLGHEAEDVAYQLGHTDGGVLVRKLYGHPSEQLARERLRAGFGRKLVPLRAVSGASGEQKGA